MKTVDLTKVSLQPKAFLFLCVAFSLVLVAYSVGQWGSVKIKDILKGASGAVASEAEEL